MLNFGSQICALFRMSQTVVRPKEIYPCLEIGNTKFNGTIEIATNNSHVFYELEKNLTLLYCT